MLYQTASHPVFQLLAQMAHVRFHRRKWVYTLGFRRKIAHKGSHAETGAFPSAITVRLCAVSEILFIPPHFYIHTFPGSL